MGPTFPLAPVRVLVTYMTSLPDIQLGNNLISYGKVFSVLERANRHVDEHKTLAKTNYETPSLSLWIVLYNHIKSCSKNKHVYRSRSNYGVIDYVKVYINYMWLLYMNFTCQLKVPWNQIFHTLFLLFYYP